MTEGFKVQASIKDADGDMVNFRADTNEELEHHLMSFPFPAYAAAKANLRGAGAAAPIVHQQQPTVQPQQQAPQVYNGPPPSQQWQGQQQQAPQQQRGPGHPEGKACDACNGPLEFKTTGSGKGVWRCGQWRWNNGNPNEHTQLWA